MGRGRIEYFKEPGPTIRVHTLQRSIYLQICTLQNVGTNKICWPHRHFCFAMRDAKFLHLLQAIYYFNFICLSMNSYTSLCFSVLLVSVATYGQTDSTSSGKPFAIKSGRIVYTFFAITSSGERVFTFDDWGNTFKEEITTIQDTAGIQKFLMAVKGASKSAADSVFNSIHPILALLPRRC